MFFIIFILIPLNFFFFWISSVYHLRANPTPFPSCLFSVFSRVLHPHCRHHFHIILVGYKVRFWIQLLTWLESQFPSQCMVPVFIKTEQKWTILRRFLAVFFPTAPHLFKHAGAPDLVPCCLCHAVTCGAKELQSESVIITWWMRSTWWSWHLKENGKNLTQEHYVLWQWRTNESQDRQIQFF